MADMPWEHAAEARAALNAIVTDPEHGVTALSSPRTMSNLLKDLLPDAPREKNLLVAAAEAGLADTLREHVSQGMDSGTAIRLTASSFSERTPLTPDACNWVTGEIAVAMGISEGAEGSVPGGQPQGFAATGQVPTEVTPVQESYPPGPASYPPGPASYPPGPASYPPGPAGSSAGLPAYSPETYSPGPAGYRSGQAAYSPEAPGYPPPGYSPGTPAAYSPGTPAASSPGGPVGYAAGTGAAPGLGSAPGQSYPPAPAQGPMQGYQPMPPAGQGRSSNTLAVVAFVLGIAQVIGWIIFLVPGLIAAILAVVFGFVSMKQIRRSGESGRWLAVTGVVLGALGVIVGSVLIAVGVAAISKYN